MKNFSKSLLALIIVIITVSALFAGCADNSGKTETTTASAVSGLQNDTTKEQVQTSILDTGLFNGKTLGIYSWSDTNIPEYLTLEEVSTTIDDAIANRLVRACDRLGIETEWRFEKGSGSYKGFIENVINVANTSSDFDVVCCYSNWAAVFTTRGVFRNINNYDQYVDFSAKCWPEMMINDCTINDKLYFCTGDISNNLIYMTSLVYFNKSIVESYKINDKISTLYGEKDLYTLVESGKWTNDAMFALAKDIYLDLDSSNSFTDGDLYGFGTYSTLVDNFYYGAGMKTIVSGPDGFSLSEDLNNVDKITTILKGVNDFIYNSGYGRLFGDHQATRTSFSNGLTLFSLAPASHAYGTHSKAEGLSYGVLPVPKYSADQTKYYSVHSIPYSMFGILSASQNPDAAAGFLQALGEESLKLTRPVFFEGTMKAKYSEVYEDSKMWDIVIDSQTFDLGRIFSESYNQLTINLFRKQITGNSSSASSMKAQYSVIEKKNKEINKELKALEG